MTASTWQFFTSNGVDQLSTAAGGYSITLPISKDNVIFGIRSVDAQGHRSPAVVPIPER